eukprot:IDg8811t1
MAATKADAVNSLPCLTETASYKSMFARSHSMPRLFNSARRTPKSTGVSKHDRMCLFSTKKSKSPWADVKARSLLRNRVRFGPKTIELRMEALKQSPGLALFRETEGAYGRNFLICGMNAIRAEILDMNTMILAMDRHKRVLTHQIVARFYDWLSDFALYVERYMIVEEDVILQWIESGRGRVKGDMRISVRMEFRGRLRKAIQDVECTHLHFRQNLPAGEKFHILKNVAAGLSRLAVDYTRRFVGALAPVVDNAFSKSDIAKVRCRLTKHIAARAGAAHVLVLYTRWMSPKALVKWKLKYLVKTELVYLSFRRWESNVYDAHFSVVSNFADTLAEEDRDKERIDGAREWINTFKRASIIHDHV